MTGWQNFCILLMLLIQTDRAAGQISVQVQRSSDTVAVSCRLLAHEEKLSQVNWELLPATGSDVIKVGTFHPRYGVHVEPRFRGGAELRGDAQERSSHLEMTLTERDRSEEKICCVFNTFPSGVFKSCADTDPPRREEEEEEETDQGLLQWCLLVSGCLVYLTSICICGYYVWRCCKRKRVYGIHKHQNISSVDSEVSAVVLCRSVQGSSENPLRNRALPPLPAPTIQTQVHNQIQVQNHNQTQTQVQNQNQTQTQSQTSQPKGFDPSKLYAKIKVDLLYGRLWKSYQGSARSASTQTTPSQPPPQQNRVYSLLSELGAVQEVEDRPSESQTGSVEPEPPWNDHFHSEDADLAPPQNLPLT